MKTIFLTSFNPFIARNILTTDVFKTLRVQTDVKLVIFVPDYKIDWFRENFSAPNVTFEGLAQQKVSRADVIFSFLCSSLVDSVTLAIHKREKLAKDNNYFKFALSLLLRKIFSHSAFVKRIVRLADWRLSGLAGIDRYFSQYRPDLLFATDVYNNDDVHFLFAARKQDVNTVGMIRSWDNVTTKGIFRAKPGRLITHNEIIEEEVIKWNDLPAERIFVGGIPQYDDYITGDRMPREDFFKKIGLDPKRKLIMYSPFGGRFFKYDWQIMETLKELGEQVLVRLTPNDSTDLTNFKPSPMFYIDQPGHRFNKDTLRDAELDAKDMHWLADSLYHSDIIVACGASIVIDAAVFNKPSVLIYFDGLEENLPYLKSAKKWLDFDHGSKLREQGGFQSALSPEEMLAAVRNYLADPKLDGQDRKSMALNQSYQLDGRSGERIGRFILSLTQSVK